MQWGRRWEGAMCYMYVGEHLQVMSVVCVRGGALCCMWYSLGSRKADQTRYRRHQAKLFLGKRKTGSHKPYAGSWSKIHSSPLVFDGLTYGVTKSTCWCIPGALHQRSLNTSPLLPELLLNFSAFTLSASILPPTLTIPLDAQVRQVFYVPRRTSYPSNRCNKTKKWTRRRNTGRPGWKGGKSNRIIHCLLIYPAKMVKQAIQIFARVKPNKNSTSVSD